MSDSATSRAIEHVDPPVGTRSADDRRWDRARSALVACWMIVLALLPFAAEKTADWSDVRDLVRSGAVTHVRVDGELPEKSTGFTTVDIHWRHGPLRYVTYVRQVRGHDSEAANSTDDASIPVLKSAPGDLLAELQPGLGISRGPGEFRADTFLGFQVPAVLSFASIVLLLLGLGLLIVGPEPWRATPWAWFWWLWNPIGVTAFLLLSGPFPGLPTRRRHARRLTGGWSFLLMLVVTSLSFTVLGVRVEL